MCDGLSVCINYSVSYMFIYVIASILLLNQNQNVCSMLIFLLFRQCMSDEQEAVKRDQLLRLGSSYLEILCYQIVVCAHLRSVDCLFVVRGVQIINQHLALVVEDDTWYNTDARSKEIGAQRRHIAQCVGYLVKMGICIPRALYFTKILSPKENVLSRAKTTKFTLPHNVHSLQGFKNSTLYTQSDTSIS